MPHFPTTPDFFWTNEPPTAPRRADGGLVFTTGPRTDFWQRTHYGFRRDDGHIFAAELAQDFTLTARLESEPNAQYDQCGLICRIGPNDWAKCSVEYETPTLSRLGSVVTVGGYSDWATQDVASLTSVHYRMDRRGPDLRFSWSADGMTWTQMRIAHLDAGRQPVLAGIYGCSPTGPGFECHAHDIRVGSNEWLPPH